MKRFLDVILSAFLLLLLSPLLLGIAIVVWLSSPGPAIFRQTRVGLDGRDFVLLKFRTMTERETEGFSGFDAGDRSRVTKVGNLLRASKLDELPQLWNVLKGEMSLVGPRPEVRQWVDAYRERWDRILCVRPGITDPASIAFRNEEQLLAAATNPQEYYRSEILPRKLDIYDEYIRTRSLCFDLRIIWRTLLSVVSGKESTK